jgi:glutaconate CoA-transferase subunit A
MTIVSTVQQAIALIPPDSLIACGGFQLNRAPLAMVEALATTKQRYNIVSLPNPLPLAILLRHNCIRHMHVSFNGVALGDEFIIPPVYRRAVEQGSVKWKESDVYEIIQGLRASGMGLPFIPALGLEGSDYVKMNEYQRVTDPFAGNEVIVIPPIAPDVAVLHVQRADKQGNLWIDDPLYDELLIKASKRVIVSCEEIVDKIDRPTIAGRCVHAVVNIPRGAYPTACLGYYDYDEAKIKQILTSQT